MRFSYHLSFPLCYSQFPKFNPGRLWWDHEMIDNSSIDHCKTLSITTLETLASSMPKKGYTELAFEVTASQKPFSCVVMHLKITKFRTGTAPSMQQKLPISMTMDIGTYYLFHASKGATWFRNNIVNSTYYLFHASNGATWFTNSIVNNRNLCSDAPIHMQLNVFLYSTKIIFSSFCHKLISNNQNINVALLFYDPQVVNQIVGVDQDPQQKIRNNLLQGHVKNQGAKRTSLILLGNEILSTYLFLSNSSSTNLI